jgi:hypothetical protein
VRTQNLLIKSGENIKLRILWTASESFWIILWRIKISGFRLRQKNKKKNHKAEVSREQKKYFEIFGLKIKTKTKRAKH